MLSQYEINIVNKEYAARRKNFKPVFGNDTHLEVVRLLHTIDIDTKKLIEGSDKLATKELQKISKKIFDTKRQVIFLLKKE